MGYKKFLGPGSWEWVTRNSWEKLSTFSPDFPVKDSWEFPRIFLKIVTWDGILSATERKLAKQSLIGRIRTNPDLGSI